MSDEDESEDTKEPTQEDLRRQAIERGLARIMEHPDSRAWLRDHLDFCGPLRSSFTGEALSSAFAEGQRNAGLRVMCQVLEKFPVGWGEMMG
ncbi:MAG: hypothetical protein RL095_1742 [Verrucomicrobiota bacterium]|jgi:hypothetical protein